MSENDSKTYTDEDLRAAFTRGAHWGGNHCSDSVTELFDRHSITKKLGVTVSWSVFNSDEAKRAAAIAFPPPPKRVRAEVHTVAGTWALGGDAEVWYWRSPVTSSVCLPCEVVAEMSALQARADSEGMVEVAP